MRTRILSALAVGFVSLQSRAVGMAPSPNGEPGPDAPAIGTPIHTGYFFADGVYVETPYVVARDGTTVNINGHVVYSTGEPPPERPEVDYHRLPDGLTENSTFDDVTEVQGALLREVHYHTPDLDEALRKVFEFYGGLPFVVSVTATGKTKVVVRDRRGHDLHVSLVPLERKWIPPTRQELIAGAIRKQGFYDRRLRGGSCIFWFSDGGEMSFGAFTAARVLKPTVAVLESSLPAPEKRRRLVEMGFLLSRSYDPHHIVECYRGSEQLRSRLGIQPEDIPGEAPAGTPSAPDQATAQAVPSPNGDAGETSTAQPDGASEDSARAPDAPAASQAWPWRLLLGIAAAAVVLSLAAWWMRRRV